MLDTSYQPLESRQYALYGEGWGEQGTAQTPSGFTGEPTDANDLVYLRARYYNPMLGVFLSPDPLEGSLMQPQSLNRYAYVQDNPINLTDPSGLIFESPATQNSCWRQSREVCLDSGVQSTCMNICEGESQTQIGQIRTLQATLADMNVILTSYSPYAGDPSSNGGGCWSYAKVNTVWQSVDTQNQRIQAATLQNSPNSQRYLKDFLPQNPIHIVMSDQPSVGGEAAMTIIRAGQEYGGGPDYPRIIIWNDGKQPWAERAGGHIIFSPYLITHEFGHIITQMGASYSGTDITGKQQKGYILS